MWKEAKREPGETCSFAQSYLTLVNPIDCSMPRFPVLHHFAELAQTHVHWQWCHPTISSSVIPFSSCLQSFPESGSFPMSQFFTSGSQSIEPSAAASVLPMNVQGWFPLGLTGLISLLSKGLSRVFSNTTVWRHQFFGAQPFHCPILTSIHYYWKNHSFDYTSFTYGSAGKESTCNVGDLGSIPGLGRSPGEGKGYPLHYSGLENSMDCIVPGVT